MIDYNNFHSDLQIQKQIIKRNDFTYKNVLNCVWKYIPRNKSILDVGSGAGTLSFFFSFVGNCLTGIEISSKAIRFSRRNSKLLGLENIKFVNKDFLKYKSRHKYDVVTCFEVLEHLENDTFACVRINLLLKPHGFLLLSVPSRNAPLFRLGLLKKFDSKVGHLRRYSANSISRLVEETGFRVIKVCRTEGLLRNLFFTNRLFGRFIKIVKQPLFSEMFNLFDTFLKVLFGESQIVLVAKKK